MERKGDLKSEDGTRVSGYGKQKELFQKREEKGGLGLTETRHRDDKRQKWIRSF